MRIQPEMKTHENALKQLRAERHAEDSRLTALKTKLQAKLTSNSPTLFAVHTTGRVNAA